MPIVLKITNNVHPDYSICWKCSIVMPAFLSPPKKVTFIHSSSFPEIEYIRNGNPGPLGKASEGFSKRMFEPSTDFHPTSCQSALKSFMLFVLCPISTKLKSEQPHDIGNR
jgi:hypothetical protein